MPKILFAQPILDEDGEEVKEGSFRTLRSTCCACLYAPVEGDEKLAPDKKSELAFFALRIQHKDEMDLKSEQIALLKDRVGKLAPKLVILRAHRLLEGKPQLLTEEELNAE